MFLPDIESRPATGIMGIAFKKLREAGSAVPQIMHLFRFKKRSTKHLVRFTEQVMRGPSPLSRGVRELIGAYLSARNGCAFCSNAHAPVAARLLGRELVEEVLRDLQGSRLDAAHKALLRYVGKIAENPAQIVAGDVEDLKAAGWSEEAIYDALTVASLFKFYNTWNNGSGVQAMRPADYEHSAERIVSMGYCMDFGFVGTLKVMWTGRKELRLSDFSALFRALLGRETNVAHVSAATVAETPMACPLSSTASLTAARF